MDGGVVLLSWGEGRSVVLVQLGCGVAEEEAVDEERVPFDRVEEDFSVGERAVDFSGNLTDSGSVGDFDLDKREEERDEGGRRGA